MFLLIGLLIFIPFACIWYLPLFIKHRKVVRGCEKKRNYLYAFLLGLAAFVASVALQMVFNILLNYLLPHGFENKVLNEIYGFVKILLLVGIVEELTKFCAGRLAIRGIPDISESGCMLIMGMAGLGFEAIETVGGATNALAVIVRCITALHIFWQLYMGKHWWRAQNEKKAGNICGYKKEKAKALLIPIITHTLFDYPVLKVSKMAEQELEDVAVPLAMVAFSLVLAIVLIVTISIMAYRTVKEEKLQAMAWENEREEGEAEPARTEYRP